LPTPPDAASSVSDEARLLNSGNPDAVVEHGAKAASAAVRTLSGRSGTFDNERSGKEEAVEAERSVMSRHLDKMPMPSLGWGATLAMGLVTLVIGAILVAATTASLAVIAVLLGVVMIVTGITYLVRAIGGREDHERAWRGVCGVVAILVGLALLRNLSLSIALIGLLIGFIWIIQGVVMLMEGLSGTRRHARGGWATGWTLFFGLISLIAGIVVIASPIASVGVLTILVGIWLIVLGAIEIAGAFALRHAARSGEAAEAVSVPRQRPSVPSGSTAGSQGTATGPGGSAGTGTASAADRDMARHTVPGERNVGHGSSSAGDSPAPNRDFRG
jgi:uncharacterized membrane protein HdeD (DUF308 family)